MDILKVLDIIALSKVFNMDQGKICFGLKNNSINNFIENKKFAQNHFYCCANILFLSHFLCFCYKGECKLIV
jgi:hypothetical protein